MKFCKTAVISLLAGLCFLLAGSFNPTKVQAGKGKEPILTVLNPLGTPPPIKLKAMAPRLNTLDGKTIYIVNDGYPGSNILLGELASVITEKYPNTKFVYKDKPGGMGSEDPALWKEMEERADAMILALGH